MADPDSFKPKFDLYQQHEKMRAAVEALVRFAMLQARGASKDELVESRKVGVKLALEAWK